MNTIYNLRTAIRNVAYGLRQAYYGIDVEGTLEVRTNDLIEALTSKPKRMRILETELEEAYKHIARLELVLDDTEERFYNYIQATDNMQHYHANELQYDSDTACEECPHSDIAGKCAL